MTTPNGINEARKELDSKVEKRVTYLIFIWIVGIVLALMGGFFFEFKSANKEVNEKIDKLNDKMQDKIENLDRRVSKIENIKSR